MSNATETPTGECRYCGKGIRQDRQGYWGARKRDDPHPWYCDASPDAEKRHEPAATGTEGGVMAAAEVPARPARCLRPGCARKLTSPASVALGYGPRCMRKIRQAALDEARADFTAEQQAKADELIRDGGIVEIAPGLFEAVSSKGDATYATDGRSCTCPAGAKDRRCYHELGARVLAIASRRSMAVAA